MLGCLIRLAQFCVIVYLGVNWGTSHAESPGGKAAMSIAGMAGVFAFFVIVNTILGLVLRKAEDASYRATYGGSWRSSGYSFPSEDDRERALDAVANRVRESKGMPPIASHAPALSREDEAARLQERIRRAAEDKPIPWG